MADKLIKNVSRRNFLKVSGKATLACGAVWAAGSSKFLGERLADVGLPCMGTECKPTPATWSDNAITATWLGHATVLINFYGLNILTDPVLQSRVGVDVGLGTIGPKRRVAPALTVENLPRIDLVLLSHAHLDHFDIATLKALGSAPQVVTANGTTDLLQDTKLRKSEELKWGQKTVVKTGQGDVEVEAFEVRHWGARWRHDTHRGYNGYLLRRGGKSILFGGDTALCDGFKNVRNRGPFELGIMPIGAYNPFIHSHCNPEQAVQMANDAGAKYLMPIHHTTFRLGREAYTEPLERFEAALSAEPDRIALRHAGETFVAA